MSIDGAPDTEQLVACSAAHAALLAQMHAACFAVPWSAPGFEGLLSSGGASALILTADGDAEEPCGFILWRTAADETEIVTLGVVPEYRGRGLGAALTNAVLERARAARATAMYLEVAENNGHARRLYEELGFKPAGRRRDYYKSNGGSADAIIYRRSIESCLSA